MCGMRTVVVCVHGSSDAEDAEPPRTFMYDGGASYYARWFEDSHGGDNEKFHLLLLDDPEERGSMIVRNVCTYTRRDVHKNGNLVLPISSDFSN